jgi:hypothetical protein
MKHYMDCVNSAAGDTELPLRFRGVITTSLSASGQNINSAVVLSVIANSMQKAIVSPQAITSKTDTTNGKTMFSFCSPARRQRK